MLASASASPILLLTRPREASERFLRDLGDIRARAVISPVLDIVANDQAVPLPDRSDIILTSANALRFVGDLAGRTAWCVGDQTAEAAQAAGLVARSAGGDVRDLKDLIRAEAGPGPLVYLRGANVSTDLSTRLADLGIEVVDRVVYDQVIRPLSDAANGVLAAGDPVILPIFSSRSAEALQSIKNTRAAKHVIAVSAAVAAVAQAIGPATLSIADQPNQKAMITATRDRAASL